MQQLQKNNIVNYSNKTFRTLMHERLVKYLKNKNGEQITDECPSRDGDQKLIRLVEMTLKTTKIKIKTEIRETDKQRYSLSATLFDTRICIKNDK